MNFPKSWRSTKTKCWVSCVPLLLPENHCQWRLFSDFWTPVEGPPCLLSEECTKQSPASLRFYQFAMTVFTFFTNRSKTGWRISLATGDMISPWTRKKAMKFSSTFAGMSSTTSSERVFMIHPSVILKGTPCNMVSSTWLRWMNRVKLQGCFM